MAKLLLPSALMVGLAGALFSADTALAMNDASKPFSFRFTPCRDQEVGRFVGQDKSVALSEMRTGRFRLFRLLSFDAPVNFEVEPDRLTLVVNDNGQVIRAFCR
jgi:hypothetical protein